MKKDFFLAGRKLAAFEETYFPREDSELLAEATEVPKNASVLDMCCGTGIQGLSALLKGAASVLAADINPIALENTLLNARKLGLQEKVSARQSDLFKQIKPEEKFDLIASNPPYLPSRGLKDVNLDGGKKGRELLERFLQGIPEHLNSGGKCFFLQSSFNSLPRTEKLLQELGLQFKLKARKRFAFEELYVVECWLQE